MRSFDPNVRPPFTFTYAQIAGRDGLSDEQVTEANGYGWPTIAVRDKVILLSCGWAAMKGQYAWDECPFDLKMKISDAAKARLNFPLPGDHNYVEQEVVK